MKVKDLKRSIEHADDDDEVVVCGWDHSYKPAIARVRKAEMTPRGALYEWTGKAYQRPDSEVVNVLVIE